VPDRLLPRRRPPLLAGLAVAALSIAIETLVLYPLGEVPHPADREIHDRRRGELDRLCRALREWSSAPIIVLSALGGEDAKVGALEAGADDYVGKPFAPRSSSPGSGSHAPGGASCQPAPAV